MPTSVRRRTGRVREDDTRQRRAPEKSTRVSVSAVEDPDRALLRRASGIQEDQALDGRDRFIASKGHGSIAMYRSRRT